MLGIRHFRHCAIDLFQGDITRFACDIMVNTTSTDLKGDAGVDKSIQDAGRSRLKAECENLRPLSINAAVVTSAGNLPARYVIHAVGPAWQDGRSGETDQLAFIYQSVLKKASTLGVEHLAIPAISTGAHGFPRLPAAKTAMLSVRNFLEFRQLDSQTPSRITFVLSNTDMYQIFQSALFETF